MICFKSFLILRFECEMCQKKFVRKTHYELHRAIHLKPNFTCNVCCKKFRQKNRLVAHWKKFHQDETYDFGMLFGIETLEKMNL